MCVLGAGPNGLWPSSLTGQRGGSSPSLRGTENTPWGIGMKLMTVSLALWGLVSRLLSSPWSPLGEAQHIPGPVINLLNLGVDKGEKDFVAGEGLQGRESRG